MPGTGGFRKMRWADARRGKGRRGGLRIIYYHFKSDHQIWLMIRLEVVIKKLLIRGTRQSQVCSLRIVRKSIEHPP